MTRIRRCATTTAAAGGTARSQLRHGRLTSLAHRALERSPIMTEDRLRNMFGQYAQADVAVPPAELVVARGRQRRRRARFGITAAALGLALTAALGARPGVPLDRAGAVPEPAASPPLPPPGRR